MAASKYAPLEELPLELVQNIFFLADMDPNLPRASTILSRSLSERFVLCKYSERAFQLQTSASRWELNRLRMMDKQKQEALFAMRWMTWDFFSGYLSWREHRPSKDPLSVIEPSVFQFGSVVGAQLLADGEGRRPAWLPCIVCSIPQKLLKGPFTDDKLQFLRCLLSTSAASVDWADYHSVQLSAMAKRQAILDRNLDAVHLFSRVRRLAKAPNLGLVKLAVLEGGCERSIVLELMTTARAWGHRRWEDVELDAWIARERAKGNPKARWLGLKLFELRRGGYANPNSGDYDGDKLVVKRADDTAFGIGNRFKLS